LHVCVLAHVMADVQDDVHQELVWDQRALAAADALTDERATQAGVALPVAGWYPSLHLNLAECYRTLGDLHRAREHLHRAQAGISALGDDEYGQLIKAWPGPAGGAVDHPITARWVVPLRVGYVQLAAHPVGDVPPAEELGDADAPVGWPARRHRRSRLVRSGRCRDGEHLPSGNHEVVRVPRMRNLSKACVQRGPQHGGRFAGAKFKPRAEPGLFVIRRGVCELNTEVAATGETDEQHGLIDTRIIDRSH
jgi:hypothetical protein